MSLSKADSLFTMHSLSRGGANREKFFFQWSKIAASEDAKARRRCWQDPRPVISSILFNLHLIGVLCAFELPANVEEMPKCGLLKKECGHLHLFLPKPFGRKGLSIN